VALGPFRDASGTTLTLSAPPRRIVSLVPSITETLFALGAGDDVAGCTIYCREPADGVATKTRVGGEKNPRLDVIRDLGADLVVANVEENVREHVETLRGWGVPVYVCYPRTVAEGIRLVRDLGEVTARAGRGAELAGELTAALDAVRAASAARRARVFCPIWRQPYMTINRDTYVHDVLAECGADNVFAERAERYPVVELSAVAAAAPDVIVLPDEPYRFRRAHLADFAPHATIPAISDGRVHFVDGKLLTWYGPRIAEALRALPPLFRS
jgi:ABC-type Fe3+-hydroxamate transport system substrate-binding protein